MKSTLRLLPSAASLIVILALLSVPIATLPALGPLLHPVQGVLAGGTGSGSRPDLTLETEGVLEPVQVHVDDRGVPHIFARNDHDLYFAQGFVTAKDRLFQLELQVRAAEGSLSEWMGPRTLDYDRSLRRFGMVHGAERAMAGMEGTESAAMLDAYSAGINAWIARLNPEDLPVEYRLLGVEPRRWEPLHTALFLKYMTRTLAGGSTDLSTSNAAARFGDAFVDRYLSGRSRWMDPIISPDHEWRFDPVAVTPPDAPFRPSAVRDAEPHVANPGTGSNNWAVSGGRTATGNPMLAGDPHLNLTLPSIWYEMQLHAPGVNVRGVTLPGSPSVIIGFNDSLAWTVTNTGADMVDWYEVEYRDSTLAEYRYEGEWRAVRTRLERIRVKGEGEFTDTVRYTHHGPVVYDASFRPGGDASRQEGLAMRWIGHEPSNESLAFHRLNRSRSVEDAVQALSHYNAPAQNFAVIDASGDIAMLVSGRFPLRWEGQGSRVGDGSSAAYDWQGWIPYDHNPRQVNPRRGFVSSANQFVTDASYPYYLGDRFAPFERGRRINDVLAGSDSITVQDMMALQLDTYDYLAAVSLPPILDSLQNRRDELDETESAMLDTLAAWNRRNDTHLTAPSVFDRLWSSLMRAVWSDELDQTDGPVRRAKRDLTAQMLVDEPGSPYFDDVRTPEVETAGDLYVRSLSEAVELLRREYGEPDGGAWAWGRAAEVGIPHLANMRGFGVDSLVAPGGDPSVNSLSGSHGPSWRMVVEMTPDGPNAFGIYPGGQSGNPGSPDYVRSVEEWARGRYHPLDLLAMPPDGAPGFAVWTLNPPSP